MYLESESDRYTYKASPPLEEITLIHQAKFLHRRTEQPNGQKALPLFEFFFWAAGWI
jgi:hypothetical protein